MRDLHTHLGGAVPAAVLWETLCETGLQTEFNSFDELHDYLTAKPECIRNLDDFLNGYFYATELIQSSPHAAEVTAYQAVAKAYRRSTIAAMELRYNPFKRLRRGVHHMDAIVMATIQGLQRASMHYKVKTGIVLTMGKELSLENNAQIAEVAMRFFGTDSLAGANGVVGLDMAGPESLGKDRDKEWLKQASAITDRARCIGLGITWHVGETSHSGIEGISNVLDWIRPDRLGHAIELRKARGTERDAIFKRLRDMDVCIELCPTVNLVTHSIESIQEMANFIRILNNQGIAFCLNTDNPYLIRTNLKREYEIVMEALGDDAGILQKAHHYAQEKTFLKD